MNFYSAGTKQEQRRRKKCHKDVKNFEVKFCHKKFFGPGLFFDAALLSENEEIIIGGRA